MKTTVNRHSDKGMPKLTKPLFPWLLAFFFSWLAVAGMAQTATITITQTSSGITSGGYDSGAERTWTQDGVDFGAKAVLKQSGQTRLQFQANNGVIYNTTALPGRIVSISISLTDANTFDCFGGSSTRLVNNVAANYTVSGGTAVGSASNTGWTSTDFSSTNYTYFALKKKTGASYANSIVIEYELPASCTPPADPNGSISGTTPACTSTTLSYTPGTGEPVSGIDYYWQTSDSGTSTDDDASSSLNVTASGNYYVRAYDSAGDCWSDNATAAYPVTINSAPSINTQPSNQNAVVGNTANFSVSATGATSYQWQVDDGSGWADVSNGSGGTTSSYTTPATTLGMDGYQYRVKVTNSCGTVNSNAVTLNVSTAVIYELITTFAEFEDGDYVVVGYNSTNDTYHSMNNTYTSGYLNQTAITPVSNEIINPSPTIVWHIQEDTPGKYTMYNADAGIYTSCDNSGNNVQIPNAVTSDKERWTVTSSSGVFIFTNASYTSRMLQYNAGSPRFACYTSNQVKLNLYKLSGPVVPAPQIAVSQNSNPIASGSGEYDFGNQLVSTSSSAITFTIDNPGTDDLNLGTIALSGADAGQFSLTQAVSATVADGDYTTFTVTFSPTSTGAKTATVTIPNDAGADYTFTVKGSGVNSTASDILANASYSYTQNINYLNWQSAAVNNTADGVGVFEFIIRDGAGSSDADALSTTVTGMTISYIGTANTILAAALFDGTTKVGNATVGANSITFSGLSLVAADNTNSNNYTLRVSFSTTVTDNEQLQFTITSADASLSGSTFASGNAGGAQSSTSGDNNRIEVIADRIAFAQQPTNTGINVTMSAVTVSANDVNGNRDLDFTGSINLTSTGTMTGDPLATGASAGLATFSSIVHTADGTGYTLTATSTGLGFSNSTTSSSFDITTIAYVNGDYRTTASGSWVSNSGTNTMWERLQGGSWTAAVNTPNYNTSNTIYIQDGHTVTTGGSFGTSVNIVIMDGGTLNVNHASTAATTLVHGGATLNITGAFTVASGGTIEVEDNGTINYDRKTGNPYTSIFNGTENFHPASNFVVKNWDAGYQLMSSDVSTNTYNGYTAAFGNVTLDMDDSANNITLIFSGISANMAHGNLTFLDYNQTTIRLATTGTVTSGIGGDFIVDDLYPGTGIINMKTSGTLDFTIGGDMQLDAATTRIFASSSGSSTVTVNGDLNITPSAVLDFNSTVAAGATSTLNLKGNLSVAGSGLLHNSNSSNLGTLNFIGTGVQTIDIASTSANENRNINFTVNNGAYVQLINRNFELGANSSMIVNNGGTLDFGFDGSTPLAVAISGAVNGTSFSSAAGSTLKITSPDGVNTSGNSGNVLVATRSFNQDATFHYIGKANQVPGTAITAGTDTRNVIVELESNAYTLNLSNDVRVSNALTFVKGNITTGVNKVIITSTGAVSGASASTGWVNGNLQKHVAVSASSNSFEVGTTDYSPVSMNYNSVSVAGNMTVYAMTPDHAQLATSTLDASKSINRYWNISQSGITLGSYSPTFTFVNADKDAGVNTAQLEVALYNASWSYPAIGTRTANSTQALNVTGYGDFAVAQGQPQSGGNPPVNDEPKPNNPGLNNVSYVYPNCLQVSGTTIDATINAATGLKDVWYQFTAISSGVSIKVSSTEIDSKVFLFNYNDLSTPLDTEDLIQGLGTEILNYNNLVAGQKYRIAVAPADGVEGDFKLCLQQLRLPLCDKTGTMSLCDLFKIKPTGATSINVSFTDDNENTVSQTTSTFVTLSQESLGLKPEWNYSVDLIANYNALVDGLGNPEPMQVANPDACNITIAPHALVEVRANQRCETLAVLPRNSYLNASVIGASQVCGANGYKIEFVEMDGCNGQSIALPIEKVILGTLPQVHMTYLFPNADYSGMTGVGYWKIRWKPRFANGYYGTYGPEQIIAVNGTAQGAGMALDPSEASSTLTTGENIDANIYPNPNNGDMVNINVTGINNSDVYVRIMDAMGREVYQNHFEAESSLNTIVSFSKPLASGLYMVEFRNGDNVITQRMMVSK